jgi:hypothetical protein
MQMLSVLKNMHAITAAKHRWCGEIWSKLVDNFIRHMQIKKYSTSQSKQVSTANSNNISQQNKCRILIYTRWINIPSKLDGIRCCYILVGGGYCQYNTIRLQNKLWKYNRISKKLIWTPCSCNIVYPYSICKQKHCACIGNWIRREWA